MNIICTNTALRISTGPNTFLNIGSPSGEAAMYLHRLNKLNTFLKHTLAAIDIGTGVHGYHINRTFLDEGCSVPISLVPNMDELLAFCAFYMSKNDNGHFSWCFKISSGTEKGTATFRGIAGVLDDQLDALVDLQAKIEATKDAMETRLNYLARVRRNEAVGDW